MDTLYDISPTFVELADETFQAAAGWWFDQISTDGTVRFGDDSYRDMEIQSNLLLNAFGGHRRSEPKAPENARQVFIDALIKNCKEFASKYCMRPFCPTDQLCFPLATDYGISKESMFAPALTAIGIPIDANPLPMKTRVAIYPGLVTKYPNEIIYSNKNKWLEVWREIEAEVASWDGEELIINARSFENKQYWGTLLVSPAELYHFLSQ